MSNQSNIHSLALQDILLSIADSLNQAQQQLHNIAPYDQYGRPNTQYHLPYLDFTLKVFTEFETETSNLPTANTGSSPGNNPTNVGSNAKWNKMNAPIAQQMVKGSLLKFTPVTANNAAQNANNNVQIESTISGRFVAVVPNEGQAQMVLSCQCSAPVLKSGSNTIYQFDLLVQVKNAMDEPVVGTLVEFNFDAVESQQLNGVALQRNPSFSINEGPTNAQGLINARIEIGSADYNSQKTFFFTINASNVFQHISVSKS